jgi:hypothetical protein
LGYLSLAKVCDNPLGAIVKRRCHDDDLVTLIQRIFVKILPETLTEICCQAATQAG